MNKGTSNKRGTFKFQAVLFYQSVRANVWEMEGQTERKADKERKRGSVGRRLFSLQRLACLCVSTVCLPQSLSLSLSLSVETVNTDASECLHKQTQSPVQTHTHTHTHTHTLTHTHTKRQSAWDRQAKTQTWTDTPDPWRKLTIRVILVCVHGCVCVCVCVCLWSRATNLHCVNFLAFEISSFKTWFSGRNHSPHSLQTKP